MSNYVTISKTLRDIKYILDEYYSCKYVEKIYNEIWEWTEINVLHVLMSEKN